MISVIIPCYNQQAYIADAVESVLNQRCEVIVVDDGSTDHSLDIAKRYEPQIHVIHQVNKGLATARNTGIMNARGDYVIPLDSDDILMPQCVARVEEYLETQPDIVIWDFKCFGIENHEVHLALPTVESFTSANRMAYCSAFRKTALLEIGGYSPRMNWGYEDYHLAIDLLKRGKSILHIPEILFLYRTKKSSMITEAQKHHDELMNQIKKDHFEIFN